VIDEFDSGTTLGRYEIRSKIGEGGMGASSLLPSDGLGLRVISALEQSIPVLPVKPDAAIVFLADRLNRTPVDIVPTVPFALQ
jgi:hypothetical protein